MYPLVVILGPTGSGKTALSLALAERFPVEVLSCDSVAVYREFEIGTAKPSLEDRARVPHHMIDIVSPAEEMTAGEYARRGRAALARIRTSQRLPVVAGGSGLYLRALIEGLFSGPARSEALRTRLRRRADERGGAYLRRLLLRIDHRAAARIHANDVPKLIRAIEVCLMTRTPMSELLQQGREPLEGFRLLTIGLDPERQQLYDRIARRCERMFASGLIDETRALLKKYPALRARPNSPINAPGYSQAVQHIEGASTAADATRVTTQAHRNYAKRQLTWFRNQHRDACWLRGFGDDEGIQSRVSELCSQLSIPAC